MHALCPIRFREREKEVQLRASQRLAAFPCMHHSHQRTEEITFAAAQHELDDTLGFNQSAPAAAE